MKLSYVCVAAFGALIGLSATHTSAAVIDFETTPAGGIPVDDTPLATPYNIAGGGTVSFFFDANGNNTFDSGVDILPVFEAYGPDVLDGFANATTLMNDTANGGLAGQLGSFFLRQFQPGTPPPPFIVDYNTVLTITALQGEIWDIDGAPTNTEQWRVEVLDGANSILTSQISPLGNSLAMDGLPWVFSFTGLPAGVDKLRITFIGSKTNGLGLAFNNFDPTSVPEPGAISLAAISVAAAMTVRRRSRSR